MTATSAPPRGDALAIPDRLATAIHDHRDDLDREGRLPAALLERLRAAGAFALLTPPEYGGFALSLTDELRVLERFGALDASVAWNVWNGNLGFCAALLPQEGADAMWGDASRAPVVANSARPTGTATRCDGGVRLSGRWDIVSAVDSADWVALFALAPPVAEGGHPDLLVCFVPRHDLTVLATWNVNALRGTGSNSVVADDVFVPAALITSPLATSRIDHPTFRIPAFTLASTGAAAILVGIAQGAIDELCRLADRKPTQSGGVIADTAETQRGVGEAQAHLDAARLLLLDASGAIDAAALTGAPVDERLRARLRGAMAHATVVAREVLTSVYALASSAALYDGNLIERAFRDGHAAAQHGLLHRAHLETYGRTVLGRPAGVAIL